MHSLPHSLIPGVQLAPTCVSWAGTQGFGWLLSLTPSIFTSSAGDSSHEAGAEWKRRQETDQHCTDGKGNMDSPPPWGQSDSHSSKGRGRLAKRVSGQTLLQGCHSTALPSNARLGRKPPPQARPSRNCCCFGELFDYQSQYCSVGTPPLPSTCT